jgi:hypothetical protein
MIGDAFAERQVGTTDAAEAAAGQDAAKSSLLRVA